MWYDFSRFDDLFQGEFFQFSEQPSQRKGETIKEQDDEFVLSVDLPGVEESAIEITVDKHTLQITSERNGRKASRTFSLGDSVDEESISAAHKQGVLVVTLPKLEAAKPRKIPLT